MRKNVINLEDIEIARSIELKKINDIASEFRNK